MRYFILLLLFPVLSFAQKEITLEDIFVKGVFRSDFVAGFRSMNDGHYYAEINAEQKLVKVEFTTGKEVETIADFGSLTYNQNKIVVGDYSFNADEKLLLLFEAPENIYRRSVLYKVYVYNIATKEIKPVYDEKILHASFSPDGNSVAFVSKNNLYINDLKNGKLVQVTEDGKNNEIINGNCDWVYEEEFEFTKAYEWSPNGKYLSYYKFNESKVKEYNFAMYDNLYPTDYRYKYPKAGEDNSKVGIYIYDVEKMHSYKINIEDEADIYVPRIKWSDFNNALLIYKMNRLQNKLQFYLFEPALGGNNARVVFEENNKYYIEIKDDIYFYKSRNAFVYCSEKSGYNHLYLYDIDKQSETQLTSGNWEVTEIKGVDEKKQLVYYMSTEKSPLERNLYSLQIPKLKKNIITPAAGTNRVEFNSDYSYFMNVYSNINQAAVYSIMNNKGQLIRILKDNKKLNETIQSYNLPQLKLIQLPNGNGDMLNAWILEPRNFNDGSKHPLLMFQYSGPGSQQVSNSFSGRDLWWYQMLAQKGYVIACVDGRGTGFRGEEFKKCTYLQLGKLESDDQIAAAKHFATWPQIDAKRIGIWGWSFGGYMSSICICKGAEVFKSAIAVAPVTNWRYYDNIYTERYMRTPQENAKGYDDNSPVNMVDRLSGKYLLIHGSADDNVHYQNSLMMINALIKANKEFDSEVYPNKNHGIGGGNTRFHLYRRLTDFIYANL